MIKNIKFLKLSFFKNTSTEGGALKEAIKHKQPNEIIIHSQTKKNGRMWGSCLPKKLLKLLESNKGIYEVISSYPAKVYFDIDADNKDSQTDPSLSSPSPQTTKYLVFLLIYYYWKILIYFL
jgi:hypothetical protein